MSEPKILLFRGKGFFSTLIRWQTRSPFSHAAILLPDGVTIIESWQGEGVRKKKVTNWSDIDKFTVNVSPEVWEKVIAFCESQVGKKYDYLQVLRFVSRRKGKDDSKWFCSELVFRGFELAGEPLLARKIGRASCRERVEI